MKEKTSGKIKLTLGNVRKAYDKGSITSEKYVSTIIKLSKISDDTTEEDAVMALHNFCNEDHITPTYLRESLVSAGIDYEKYIIIEEKMSAKDIEALESLEREFGLAEIPETPKTAKPKPAKPLKPVKYTPPESEEDRIAKCEKILVAAKLPDEYNIRLRDLIEKKVSVKEFSHEASTLKEEYKTSLDVDKQIGEQKKKGKPKLEIPQIPTESEIYDTNLVKEDVDEETKPEEDYKVENADEILKKYVKDLCSDQLPSKSFKLIREKAQELGYKETDIFTLVKYLDEKEGDIILTKTVNDYVTPEEIEEIFEAMVKGEAPEERRTRTEKISNGVKALEITKITEEELKAKMIEYNKKIDEYDDEYDKTMEQEFDEISEIGKTQEEIKEEKKKIIEENEKLRVERDELEKTIKKIGDWKQVQKSYLMSQVDSDYEATKEAYARTQEAYDKTKEAYARTQEAHKDVVEELNKRRDISGSSLETIIGRLFQDFPNLQDYMEDRLGYYDTKIGTFRDTGTYKSTDIIAIMRDLEELSESEEVNKSFLPILFENKKLKVAIDAVLHAMERYREMEHVSSVVEQKLKQTGGDE